MTRSVLRQLGKLRRWLSRSETMVRWLGLSKSVGTSQEPGLILIQIDGLSRTQFEKALRRRRMPFLRKLLRKRSYRIHTMYSGLPSSTPAVQGELFYGVKCAVPAFSFRDPATDRLIAMFDNGPACRVEARLENEGVGLLAGGSAYGNIYSGGAVEPHFCAVTMGWNNLLQSANPLVLASIVFWNAWSIVRVGTLMGLELIVAIKDFIYGQVAGKNLAKELKMIPSRIAVSIGLRELIVIGASMDAARGLPVIQLNFLGYDEQAHRRGPGSAFAHWTLLGIDDAIKRIYKAARRSQRRRYSVWVYSDHGQEKTISYARKYGRTVQEAVSDVFGQAMVLAPPIDGSRAGSHKSERAQWLKCDSQRRHETPVTTAAGSNGQKRPVVEVAAMGPIGHVYPGELLTDQHLDELASALAGKGGIPMVLRPTGDGEVRAWTKRGSFELPRDAREVLGAEHPFLEEAACDLACLCQHPAAGRLILCGFSLDGPLLTFAEESGAHAGPGPEETRAFVITPADAPLREREYLRPLDLRRAVLRFLGRDTAVHNELRGLAMQAPQGTPAHSQPPPIALPSTPLELTPLDQGS